LENNKNCRLELVSTRHIRRMPTFQIGVSRTGVGKIKEFAKKRGHCKPVVLSDSGGCMTLLSGAATFEACLEEKDAKIPAVIVQTEGEADNLMFALQSAELNEPLCPVAAGAAIVRLIDSHSVPRKEIADKLGKSPAWLSKTENLCRKLNAEVQKLVVEGYIPPRSAQEIARLPKDVQMPFAVSSRNNFLNKENVTYLVNRYLNEDISPQERDRIVNSPRLALPNELKYRGKTGRDNSDSARLSRAIARCFDDVAYLKNLLSNINIGDVAVRITDIDALVENLAALQKRLSAVFYPGENENANGGDVDD